MKDIKPSFNPLIKEKSQKSDHLSLRLNHFRCFNSGFSLAEVLLTLAMLSLAILPIFVLIQQLGTNSKGNYIISSRNILLSRLVEEIDPENPNFYNDYNDSSIQTLTESGTLIGYMRKVDTANSTALKRRIHFYLCQETSGATCTPTYKYTQDFLLDELRIDCGAASNTPYADNSGLLWLPDAYSYNAGNKVPGYSNSFTAASSLGSGIDVLRTINDTLYLTSAEVSTTTLADYFTYNFDVDNGNYMVQLYFTELTSPGPVTRYTDVTIEGTKVLDDYNPSATTAVRTAEVKVFQTAVSDSVLNVKVENGGAVNPVANKARLAAILIRRLP